MPSKSRSQAFWRTLCAVAAGLALTALSPPPSGTAAGAPQVEPSGAAPAARPQTFLVGQAKLSWHLTPDASARRAGLVEAFRQATEAHLTGGEPYVTPKAEPTILPGGRLRFAVPAELIHTLFVGADGRNYCSDGTVSAKKAAVRSTGLKER